MSSSRALQLSYDTNRHRTKFEHPVLDIIIKLGDHLRGDFACKTETWHLHFVIPLSVLAVQQHMTEWHYFVVMRRKYNLESAPTPKYIIMQLRIVIAELLNTVNCIICPDSRALEHTTQTDTSDSQSRWWILSFPHNSATDIVCTHYVLTYVHIWYEPYIKPFFGDQLKKRYRQRSYVYCSLEVSNINIRRARQTAVINKFTYSRVNATFHFDSLHRIRLKCVLYRITPFIT